METTQQVNLLNEILTDEWGELLNGADRTCDLWGAAAKEGVAPTIH